MKPYLSLVAAAIAEKTADAYSYDTYGPEEWRKMCRMLLRAGYDERQVEAIVRSKWTRWANDMVGGRRGRAIHLEAFMKSTRNFGGQSLAEAVDELVRGTFGTPTNKEDK